MRYGQITTSRLSGAARKLDSDGEWHPYQMTPLGWYRIWRKRLIQRVTFENEREQHILLPFLVHLEPVELATHGFREELTIRLLDDVFEVVVPLGYSDPRGEKALLSFKRMGITLRDESGLVVAHVPLSSLSSSDLGAVQEQIVEIRETFQSAVNQA